MKNRWTILINISLCLILSQCAKEDAGLNWNNPMDSEGNNWNPPSPVGMILISSKDSIFNMGSTNGNSDEQPVHTVSFTHDYWMDATEVTQADFTSLMGFNPSNFSTVINGPVEEVTWFDAVLYCNERSKRDGLDTVYTYTSRSMSANSCINLSGIVINYNKKGYRLPTEAEWEYACRAGTTTDYYWGNENFNNYAWWTGNSSSTTHPVAQKLPNNFGLYDMSGNVYEWCNDWYGNYISDMQNDPTGPVTGANRVLRGGAWGEWNYLRSALRVKESSGNCNNAVGFRCVRSR